jgi:hypothetical protein
MDHVNDDGAADEVTISPAIPGLWIHSWEEDAGDIEVYRRFFDFPSFPRDAFELLRDHTFIQEEVDSTGSVVTEQARGRFRQPADDRLTVSFGDGVHAGFTLQAVELSQDLGLLRVRRLAGPSLPAPSLPPPVLYRLSNQEPKLRVRLTADPSGSVDHLTFGVDDGADRVFSGAEISSVATPDSIRATVVLDPGTETASRVSFDVIVPVVVVGPEPPDHGPFGVFAAGLRIEHFPKDAPAGPRQAIEAIVLTGRAIAHGPTDGDAPATG